MTTPEPRTGTDLVAECTLLGLRLAAALRHGDRTQVDQLLEEIPGGRMDVLALSLAAMVDPDLELSTTTGQVISGSRRPRLTGGPELLPREHGTRRGYRQHRDREEQPCPECTAAWAVARRPLACQVEYARLRSLNVSVLPAAELSRAVHVLSRPAHPEESP